MRILNKRHRSKRQKRSRRSLDNRSRLRDLRVESLEHRQLLAADTLLISIENLSDSIGLANTPVWVAAHDGNFDVASLGETAADFGGLELIAEEGQTTELIARFSADGNGHQSVIAAPDGFPGAPVFEPGEIASGELTIDDTTSSPYFSFASMVIPSNDAFIANLDPLAYRLFDSAGDFLGPRSIVIYGSQIWDAGTELNDPSGGAAFSAAGGISADEDGVIARHLGLDGFVDTDLANGEILDRAFGANTPIARITISQMSAPSNPIDQDGPNATLDAPELVSRVASHAIQVTYSDPSGIDLTSIDTNDLRITGPSLTQLDVLSVDIDAASGTTPREVTATYHVAPESGAFNHLDNGVYSVVLRQNEVNDPFALSAEPQLLGELSVDAPVRLIVDYENLSAIGGLTQTPLWVGVHEGNFEIARSGVEAANFEGLEALAEDGSVTELASRFQSESSGSGAVITAAEGFPDAPVIEPSEIGTAFIDVHATNLNRFLSFATMVIPSNDAFLANLDPRGYELFDRFGNFTGARSITLYGQDVWDAGTEANAINAGAPFSTGGGIGVDENGLIRRHEGLDEFVGSSLPTGTTLDTAFSSMTPLGRLTISLADLPSDPIDTKAPQATFDSANIDAPGQPTHQLSVTYSDASGIDLGSIDVNDLQVIGVFGEAFRVTDVTTDATPGTTPRTVTATYEISKTDSSDYSALDNGQVSVSLVDGEVNDVFANEVNDESFGIFEILVPVELTITVENLAIEGGLTQTPLWFGIHEGNFQTARVGQEANNFGGLELIAEDGDPSELATRFAATSGGSGGVITAPDGFSGAPVIEPREVGSAQVSVFNTNENRFFSFANMLIPSNDAFLANLNPRAYELFDQHGFYRGDQSITVTGRDVWDAGTEVNAIGAGAPFATAGGVGVDENGVIHRHEGLNEFIGSALPTGGNLLSAFNSDTPLLRITIALADGSALPFDQSGPVATATSEDVVDAGATSQEIVVTYNDPSGIDLSSIGTDDIVVRGPLGVVLDVDSAVAEPTTSTVPNNVSVTYTVSTSDDQFTARNNGRYSIEIIEGGVSDTIGRSTEASVPSSFSVDVGVRIQVEFESLTESGGLYLTPVWVGIHDGSFDVARGGFSASEFGGLELIAEEGDASELIAHFEAETEGSGTLLTAPAGFAGAPVFDPGDTASQIIEVTNSRSNRYLSFASMIIPSNDAFIANRDARAFELFDSLGNFRGERHITVYGRDILDAGTEINNPNDGAAFSTGEGTSVDENGVIRLHDGLDEFIGTGLPTGENLASAFDAFTPIGVLRVSLVDPEADVCSGIDGGCSVRSVSLQNAQLRSDVNRDGIVSARDALAIINFLDQFGSLSTIENEVQSLGLDLDVGGDSIVSTIDALFVINELDRQRVPEIGFEGEGEFIDSVDAAFSEIGSDIFNDEDEESLHLPLADITDGLF